MARAAFDELALGAFGPATEFLDGVRAALVREWMRFDGFVPRLCEFGLVDGPLARQWLQQVVRRC
jgi:hypothetical protein